MTVIARTQRQECPQHAGAPAAYRDGRWWCCAPGCDTETATVEYVTLRADDWQGAVDRYEALLRSAQAVVDSQHDWDTLAGAARGLEATLAALRGQ